MISRSETILEDLTDEALEILLKSGKPNMVYRAAILLLVPAEFRQGVEARHHELMFSPAYSDSGLLTYHHTGVSFKGSYDMALHELRVQLGDAV